MLKDEQISQFKKDGFLFVKDLIDAESIKKVYSRALELVAVDAPEGWEESHFHRIGGKQYQYPSGLPRIGGFQRPLAVESVFGLVAEHPSLIAAMSALLGGDVKLFTDQIAVKDGRVSESQGSRSYYHQDSSYWHIEPEQGCNCWIPFTQMSRDACALGMLPGSHRDWTLIEHETYYDEPALIAQGNKMPRRRIPESQINRSTELVIDMAPGDGLFFTTHTWHRSEPNFSQETKSFYAIAYERV